MSTTKSMVVAAMVLLTTNCTKPIVNENENEVEKAQVSIRVNGFTISQESMPVGMRAASVGDYDGVNTLTLAFYKSDGTETYKVTHTKGSMPEGDTFGEFSTSLPIGSYTMVVLGYALYDDDALTLTSPTQAEWTVGAPRETFAATQEVNITNTSAVELTATLNRIVAQLRVNSSDNRTDNVEKIRMTFAAGGKAFDPTTGLATVNTGSVSTVSIGVEVGARSGSIGYIFLATDEQDMSVTIETLDSEGNTIFSKTVNDVPFKRNRITKLTGAIYSASAEAGSFQVNTEWIGTVNMNF